MKTPEISVPELMPFLVQGVPPERIQEAYGRGRGDELRSGKFFNPDSSACLAANTFGWFVDRHQQLPAFPGGDAWGDPESIHLEQELRFPWSGGKHPVLDAVIRTRRALIGVESKRYEPFRKKGPPGFTEAYWRRVWGPSMKRYERMRDLIKQGEAGFQHLDAAQLVKHAFGLRSEAHRKGRPGGRHPVLLYLYAEPERWGGKPLDARAKSLHRREALDFAARVAGDEVAFVPLSYRDLLKSWAAGKNNDVRNLVDTLRLRFDV